ncbi:23S rRNA (adenine(2030)-N(6))-methyltransferase RlmJ [Paraglaciecola sp. 2405UD69-4]|uniref:23S rRNA (adenine(2030)-N(6))-methyltransferase RlmJ n=1 Tax=Paraglaciecola sp. 2405UD69-4 TaxID=3391836 RepID=UPI0039C977DC
MFSYRHSFHAGNHGDVLKHICQMMLINKLKEKDKGFEYFDTHSGAGVYDLQSQEALKTLEFKQGIERLAIDKNSHVLVNQYHELVTAYQKFNQYPGSPEIAKSLLREQDKLTLMEWHPQEVKNLKQNLNGKNISIHHRDGFEGLIALTPPALKRGLVLIDPPYELESEYEQVLQTVCKVHKRWATGIFAIWYPLISERKTDENSFSTTNSKLGKSQSLITSLSQQPFKNLLNIELCVTSPSDFGGMYGSGMVIINAPWQLDVNMEKSLQQITPLLAQDSGASFKVEWLIEG